MAVVLKSQSSSNIISKKPQQKISVNSVREPSIISEMGDTNFGDLGPVQDGKIVTYDSTSNKFVLVTIDELLSVSAEDNNISDTFVNVLETELNLGQTIDNLDGGLF